MGWNRGAGLLLCLLLMLCGSGCSKFDEYYPQDAVPAPELSPLTAVLTYGESVRIQQAVAGTYQRYTINGTRPGPDYGEFSQTNIHTLVHDGRWDNLGVLTVRVRSFRQDWRDSPEAVHTWLLSPAALPVFFPAAPAGSIVLTNIGPVTVSLTSATPDAVIRYTLNGSDPALGGAVVYTGPFVLSNTAIVLAVATHSNVQTSAISSNGFFVSGSVSMPFLSQGSGCYSTNIVAVAFTDPMESPDVEFRCTTNGLDPTANDLPGTNVLIRYDSSLGSAPIRLKVIATNRVSGAVSPVVSAEYSFGVEKPRLQSGSPGSGIYTNALSVFFDFDNAAVSTFYTLNGTEPVNSVSAENFQLASTTTPVTVPGNCTLLVKSFPMTGNLPASTTLTLQYRLRPAAPRFMWSSGEYNFYLDLTVFTNEYIGSGAVKVYFTMDGSRPSRTNGYEYNSPLTISTNGDFTIRAVAVRDGWDDSDVSSVWYRIRNTDNSSSSSSSSAAGITEPPVYISAFGFGNYGDAGTLYYYGNQINDQSYSWVELTVRNATDIFLPWTLQLATPDGSDHLLLDSALLQNSANWQPVNGEVIRVSLVNWGNIWYDENFAQADPGRFDVYQTSGRVLSGEFGLFYLKDGNGTPFHGLPYKFQSAGSGWFAPASAAGVALEKLVSDGRWPTTAEGDMLTITELSNTVLVYTDKNLPVNATDWQTVSGTVLNDSLTVNGLQYDFGDVFSGTQLVQVAEQLTNAPADTTVSLGLTVEGTLTAVFNYDNGQGKQCFALQDASGAVLFYTNSFGSYVIGDTLSVQVNSGRRINGCPFVTDFEVISSIAGGSIMHYRSEAFCFPFAIGRVWRYTGTVQSMISSGEGILNKVRMFLHTDPTNATFFQGKTGSFFGVVSYSNGQYRLEVPDERYYLP